MMKQVTALAFVGCLAGRVVADTEVMMMRFRGSDREAERVVTPATTYPIKIGSGCTVLGLDGFREDSLLRIRMSWVGSVSESVL